MYKYKLKLESIANVTNFNKIVSGYAFDMDLVTGRYDIDAKSLMGIFSLDLSKSVDFCIFTEDKDIANEIVGKLKEAGINVE